jgi:hypothetical protein
MNPLRRIFNCPPVGLACCALMLSLPLPAMAIQVSGDIGASGEFDSNVFKDYYAGEDWVERAALTLGLSGESQDTLPVINDLYYLGELAWFNRLSEMSYHRHSLNAVHDQPFGDGQNFRLKASLAALANREIYQAYDHLSPSAGASLALWPGDWFKVDLSGKGGMTRYPNYTIYNQVFDGFGLEVSRFFQSAQATIILGGSANQYFLTSQPSGSRFDELAARVRLAKSLGPSFGLHGEYSFVAGSATTPLDTLNGAGRIITPALGNNSFFTDFFLDRRMSRFSGGFKVRPPDGGFEVSFVPSFRSVTYLGRPATDTLGVALTPLADREDVITEVVVGGTKSFGVNQPFRLEIRYLFQKSSSNDQSYDYDKHSFQAGFGYEF